MPEPRWRERPDAGWDVFHPVLGWLDERAFHYDTRPWRPFVEAVPTVDGRPSPEVLADGETFWANSHYLVVRRTIADGAVHLSLRTVENDTRHDWRELQRVKNELTGHEWEAVELYPAESRRVDTANQYHLWCLREGFPGIGFPDRLVLDSHEGPLARGARQRPFTS
ncbi:MAG TPA: hypothetical protein VFQ85_07450 [Mycobacteriales bacterium]|nr:hypothetical protein [Mycobacteriales bacterium]